MPERVECQARTFGSCAWESVARGGIWGAGTESGAVLADVACDAAEVEGVEGKTMRE
jgi:hypothetical protein